MATEAEIEATAADTGAGALFMFGFQNYFEGDPWDGAIAAHYRCCDDALGDLKRLAGGQSLG